MTGFGCVFDFLLSLSLWVCVCACVLTCTHVCVHTCMLNEALKAPLIVCQVPCWQVSVGSSGMFRSSQQAGRKGHCCFPIQSKSVDLLITYITRNESDLLLLITPQSPSLSPLLPSLSSVASQASLLLRNYARRNSSRDIGCHLLQI